MPGFTREWTGRERLGNLEQRKPGYRRDAIVDEAILKEGAAKLQILH